MTRAARWVPAGMLAVAALLTGCSAGPAPPPGPAPSPGSVAVTGAVRGGPDTIARYGLEKSPGLTTVTVEWRSGTGAAARTERHTEEGLDLTVYDLSEVFDAGPAGTPLRSFALLAIGADGTTAAVAQSEIGSYGSHVREYGDNAGGVLLSYREDGRDLRQPRLIVRDDPTADRCVRDVVELRVVRLDR